MRKEKYLIADSGDVLKKIYNYETQSIIHTELCPLNAIFDENNIPKELQKLIIRVTQFPFRSEWEEYITAIPFDLSEGKISKEEGKKVIEFYSSCSDYSVGVRTDLEFKTKEDVEKIMKQIRENGYLNNYVNSLIQLFGLPMVCEKDILYHENGAKVKSLK